MKKIMMMGAVMFSVGMLMSSCVRRTRCFCDRYVGCSVLVAIVETNDSVIATETICADSSSMNISNHKKAIQAAGAKYYNPHIVRIEIIDTGLHLQSLKVRCREKIPDGYECDCPVY